MATPKAILTEKDIEFVEFLRQNPVVAAETLLIRNGRPLKLTWYQRVALKTIWNKQFNMLIWSRRMGKTTTLAIYLLLSALLYPNQKCGIFSAGYRQAQFVFEEVKRFYTESPYVEQSVTKISETTAEIRMFFKNGSIIRAMPVGDGNKIRGAGFTRMVIDEAAQVDPEVIDVVIMPMLAVSTDPWASAEKRNTLVLASTAYYQFNHLYERYLHFKEKVDPNSDKYDPAYSLLVFNVLDAPPGWVDWKVIKHEKETMPRLKWAMEFMSIFPPDSEGFYSASVIEGACKPYAEVKLKGDRGKSYVMGIDPARHGDNFAVAIIELGEPNQLVYVNTLHRRTVQEQIAFIRRLCRTFNIVKIVMDQGGGGLHLKDGLAEPFTYYDEEQKKWVTEDPIIDPDDEENKYKHGARILHVKQFGSKENTEANFQLRAALESQSIVIPAIRPTDKQEERIFDEIQLMKDEMMNVVHTPLQSGYFRFDTVKSTQKKDRYSAFLLANYARELLNSYSEQPQSLPQGFWAPVDFRNLLGGM
ncbi:MAG: terminase family protein [Clostridia bacterium]